MCGLHQTQNVCTFVTFALKRPPGWEDKAAAAEEQEFAFGRNAPRPPPPTWSICQSGAAAAVKPPAGSHALVQLLLCYSGVTLTKRLWPGGTGGSTDLQREWKVGRLHLPTPTQGEDWAPWAREDGAARAASDCTTTKRRGAVLAPVPPGSLLLVRPEGNFSEVYRLSCLTPFACRSGQTSSMLGGAQFKATPLGSKALASHTPGEQRRR